MKFNAKFNYPSSVRALYNGMRLYDVNNEKLPSVTTILNETQSEEKKHLYKLGKIEWVTNKQN